MRANENDQWDMNVDDNETPIDLDDMETDQHDEENAGNLDTMCHI